MELGSKVTVATTAESRLGWRRRCGQAERPVRTLLQMGPDSRHKERCLADTAAGKTKCCREHRKEEKQRCPQYLAGVDGRMAVL